jgi:hypothetical protein
MTGRRRQPDLMNRFEAGRHQSGEPSRLCRQPENLMPSLKPTCAALLLALALGAASQPPAPASAQVFKSRLDMGKKDCEGKHGKFDGNLAANTYTYTCTFASEHKVDHCDAGTGKCTTTNTSPAKSTSAAPAPKKSLAGTGDVSKAELKKICAQNKDWMFVEENKSSAFSCMDSAAHIAINCKKNNDCVESHN